MWNPSNYKQNSTGCGYSLFLKLWLSQQNFLPWRKEWLYLIRDTDVVRTRLPKVGKSASTAAQFFRNRSKLAMILGQRKEWFLEWKLFCVTWRQPQGSKETVRENQSLPIIMKFVGDTQTLLSFVLVSHFSCLTWWLEAKNHFIEGRFSTRKRWIHYLSCSHTVSNLTLM